MPDVLGFMHVNVNCSDLARSRRFYEDALGLVASAHTRPATPQPGAGFGLSGEVLWDAWVLDDPRGMGAAASLDLLRWELPPPIGAPPGLAPAPGLHRLAYATPTLDETLARLADTAGSVLPAAALARDGRLARRAWALDPDGSAIEIVEDATVAERVRATSAVVVCRDLERSIAWYGSLLGLEVTSRADARSVTGAAIGAPGEGHWDEAVLELPRRRAHYALRLERWHAPAPVARAAPVANRLGPFRVAFLVDDAHAWHEALARRGVPLTGPPVWLDMGPEIPIAGLWALFFFDPDGTCVELIQTPELRA
jgi:catechol 2,3-dioxygenase-like lactoylglutathione lyase family enzyme